MNTEHTPGPWRVDYAQGIMTQDGAPIAYVCDDYSDTPSHDARLIAAAPELLAALKDILSGWRYIRQDPAHLSIYGVGWDRAQKAAESAIAKAEGKA